MREGRMGIEEGLEAGGKEIWNMRGNRGDKRMEGFRWRKDGEGERVVDKMKEKGMTVSFCGGGRGELEEE